MQTVTFIALIITVKVAHSLHYLYAQNVMTDFSHMNFTEGEPAR